MTRFGPSILAFVLVMAAAGVASAQTAPPGTYGPAGFPQAQERFSHVNRDGLMVGFSLGAGSFGLDDCTGCETLSGPAGNFYLGLMLSQRLALAWDLSLVSDVEEAGSITLVVNTAALQYWVTPRVWIKGGLGVGNLSFSDDEGVVVDESELGAAAMMAAGVELVQADSFALDLQLRGSAVAYEQDDTISMASLNLGFTWY